MDVSLIVAMLIIGALASWYAWYKVGYQAGRHKGQREGFDLGVKIVNMKGKVVNRRKEQK